MSEPKVSEFSAFSSCQGVLFDMDGVLLDTEPLYTVAYDRVLSAYGAHLDRQTKLEIMGRKAIESTAHVIKKFGIPMAPEAFLAAREPHLQELFGNAPAIPQAEQFVRALKTRGLLVAVATSSSRDVFAIKTQKHAWFSLFDAIVCGDDPAVRNPKPAPDIFVVAAQRLGLSAENCCAFEDSPSGARAAVASGATTYALVPERSERERFPQECEFFAEFAQALAALP